MAQKSDQDHTEDKPESKNIATFYNTLVNAVLANITNMTVWFAIIFYAFLQTRSVFATAIMSGIYTLSMATTGIWFGSLVDHNKKKTVMLGSSIVTLAFFIVSYLIFLLAPEGSFTNIQNPYFWMFVTLLLFGVIAGNIRYIAISTLVKILVPEDKRDKANGLVGTTNGVAFLVVSVLSAFLVGWGGMNVVMIIAILLNIGVIIHMWLQQIPEKRITHVDGVEVPKEVDIKGTIKAINVVPGLLALILFATFNNFLGGVFMALMDAYGLSLVSVQTWGLIWGFLSTAFILGGIFIAKFGLGKNPVKSLMMTNFAIWGISCLFTVHPSIWPMVVGMFLYLCVVPFIEASEQTIFQKVVPQDRLGRVIGFAQSVEQSASPIMAFVIGPVAQFIAIPLMSDGGAGAEMIGSWFGTGYARGIALVFTVAGFLGLATTTIFYNSKFYKELSKAYMEK